MNHASLTANHVPTAATYANAAARTAATGFPRGEGGAIVAFDSSDVGKFARQLDDDSIWVLKDDSPVTWTQVGGPGVPPGDHASEHENGGGDEIDVTGLSGLLADPQTPASHTHTAADISDFGEAVEDKIGAKVIAGTGISVTYNDTTGETEIASTGGGGGTPGGSSGDIQYNNAGAFGGSQIKRDSSTEISIQDGANAQTFRVYKNTTNNFRFRISNVSNKWELASESGTTPDSVDLLIGSSRFAFSTSSFAPPANASQTLGTSSLRWSTVFGSDCNLTGEYRWNNLTRIQAGVDGFPIVRADASTANAAGWIFGTNDVNGVRLKRNGTRLEVKLGGDSAYTQLTCGQLGVNNSAAATTLGSVTKKIEVFDASGASLGFVPVYDSIS